MAPPTLDFVISLIKASEMRKALFKLHLYRLIASSFTIPEKLFLGEVKKNKQA